MGVLATGEGESVQVTSDLSGAVVMGCRMAKGPQFVFPVLQGGTMKGVQCLGELPPPQPAGMLAQPRKRKL